jgi:hypothetical protein
MPGAMRRAFSFSGSGSSIKASDGWLPADDYFAVPCRMPSRNFRWA